MGSGEIIFEKVYASPRPPPKIFFLDNWIELGSEVAGGSEDSHQTQPKTQNRIVRTGRPVKSEQPSDSRAQEIDERVLLCASACWTFRSRQRRRRKRRRRSCKNGETRWKWTIHRLFTQREEIDIDFRVSGLPHAVVKQAQNFRVRELVKKIESHPHREALQADLQQNNVYNPFSDDSKAMIRDMGNVELFESCETIPNFQCSECLLYWNQGIVYCTCGHLLKESESSHNFH